MIILFKKDFLILINFFSASTLDGVEWWWIPVVATHIGAILGVAIYMFLIELHHPQPEDERFRQRRDNNITSMYF